MDLLPFMFLNACLFVFFKFSNAINVITLSESLSDGSTLVSPDGTFELGFFTPDSSSRRYVGIWYKNIPVRTVVWVANRENPINDSSGSLIIDNRQNLVLVGKNRVVFWSTNSAKQAQIPIVELLDSGNLVLRDAENGDVSNYLWQSFDYPTDTLIPGMKFGVNLKTGFERRLIAWKNWDDPSAGHFVSKIQPHNFPQYTIWNGSNIFYRFLVVGDTHSGSSRNPIFSLEFVQNEEEMYYITYQKSNSTITRAVMNQTNRRLERFTWNQDTKSWTLYTFRPVDYCDTFALCGANGICTSTDLTACKCLRGFEPKLKEKWNYGNWSQGCFRNMSVDCHGDGFIKFSGLKLPDTTHTWVNKSLDPKQCRAKCLENCSCSAYSVLNFKNGGTGGCAIWFNDLVDIKQIPSGNTEVAHDVFVRVSATESDELSSAKPVLGKKNIIVITVAVTVGLSGALIVVYYIHMRKRRFKEKNNENGGEMDLPLFDLQTISNATNKFAPNNELGRGGFGPVYKGTLLNGQEIAVKRLSRNSGQGVKEFKNEITLIAKLQHRNLVKLVGCCIQGEERALIYEYMPNRSLDSFIFDESRAKLLDWSKRFNIICGIARGLLYLHQDSRLRVVHRDLKTSNVLLDNVMNPKISDFGMAAFIGGDQTGGNTNKVVGTYGYMAPEYAAKGLFSVKSDVFSFGIIMLELISRKRSREFSHHNGTNLTTYAWRQWNEGNHLELIDSFVRESSDLEEVRRCIHIGLLCVQKHAEDRPSMDCVIMMLSSENYALAQPKEPAFFDDKGPSPKDLQSNKIASPSEMTMSLPEPR